MGTTTRQMRAAATTRTGLDDFGDDWFIGPLAAWAADLEQPNLTEFVYIGPAQHGSVRDVSQKRDDIGLERTSSPTSTDS